MGQEEGLLHYLEQECTHAHMRAGLGKKEGLQELVKYIFVCLRFLLLSGIFFFPLCESVPSNYCRWQDPFF